MIHIALPNSGKLNAGNLLTGAGKGTDTKHLGSSEGPVGGDDIPSFSLIFAKTVNKAAGQQEAATSSADQTTDGAGMAGVEAMTDKEGKVSLFMMKMKSLTTGEDQDEKNSGAGGSGPVSATQDADEQGEAIYALEIDLQALLQALHDGKTVEEIAADLTASGEAAAALTPYLAAMLDKIPSLGVKLSAGETGEGNKILLPLPPNLLKDFVVAENGELSFAPNGTIDGKATSAVSAGEEAVPGGQVPSSEAIRLAQGAAGRQTPIMAAAGDAPVFIVPEEPGVENASTDGQGSAKPNTALSVDETDPTVKLVRLHTQLSSSSPPGTLLAATMSSQKTIQPDPAAPKADTASVETDEPLPVNPLRSEPLAKGPGERQVREMLLNPAPGSAGDKAAAQTGTDPQLGAFSRSLEFDEQDPTGAVKGVDSGKEAFLVREDTAKGTLIVSGRESGQWVPYAGATSPQVPLGTETPLKGVFLPLDRVLSEAGAALEKGGGKVQMTLQPPSLGTINMEVVVQNNRVELVLTANHADVQQILQANSDQLKNALSNQGFQVDQMSVLLRREGFNFNLGGNPLWQGGSGHQQGQNNGFSASPSVVEAAPAALRDDYGTGTISIFA